MTELYNKDCERVVNFLIDLTEHTEIAKDEPGRITLKVSLTAYRQVVAGMDGIDLTEVLKSIKGIKKFDFSMFWRTLEIDYDTSIIDRTLWTDLINSKKNENGKQRLKHDLISLLRNHAG